MLKAFVKKNAVLCIAFVLAVLSSLIIPPDAGWAGYYDVKTLCCLFGTLAVVCALKNIRFFYILAQRIVVFAGNARTAALLLIAITFIGSMLIANDMALITFLPLGYYVFSVMGNKKEMATVFILQNIAANLGGMLTPFGNPQNLYLYSHYSIANDRFMEVMFPPFIVSISLVALCCLLIRPRRLRLAVTQNPPLPKLRTAYYLFLFALTILMVFRVLPPLWVIAAVVISLLVLDPKALRRVDYGLLLTFVCFFTFAGNMGRVEAVRSFFSSLLEKSTLLTAVLSCQVISNVPSAILLSQFSETWPALLVGVNIGGTGTLIASLASLITFREYTAHCPGESKAYILRFSAFNFSFLAVLTLFSLLVLHY